MTDSKKIAVLDHGYVKLVDSMGSDQSIIESARMSTGKGFVSWDPYARCDSCEEVMFTDVFVDPDTVQCEKHKMVQYQKGDTGLLEFMYRNGHSSPFEMVELVFEVQAPIMVFREWHRSRTQSYGELSGRYTQMPNLHYTPELPRFTPVLSTNKQLASASTVGLSEAKAREIRSLVEEEQEEIYDLYEAMLEAGVPKEVARLNTPVSRYSRMRAKANLRNWFHFLNLRMRPNAQKEIRFFANAVEELTKTVAPRSFALFEEYDLYGVKLGRTEMKIIREILELVDTSWDTKAPGKDYERELKSRAETFGIKGSALTELMNKINKGGIDIL